MKLWITIWLIAMLCSINLTAQKNNAPVSVFDSIQASETAPLNNAADSASTQIITDTQQASNTTDTGTQHKYERQYIDESALALLRKGKDFQYQDIDSALAANMKPSNTKTVSFKGFDATILLWLLGAFAAVVIILQLSKINMRQLFGPLNISAGKMVNEDVANIHDVNFEEEIRQAIAAESFSLASKLMYLHALKKLADANLVKLNINKTNWHYVYELKGKKIEGAFKDITTIFEYIRYGNMRVNKEKFNIIQLVFADFNQQLH